MAEQPPRPIIERRLRERFSRFLSSAQHNDPLLSTFFHELLDRGWAAVVFGGVIRDFVYGYGKWDLRDIDIVVDGASLDELVELCAPWSRRRTRFGGLHLRIANWPVDIWRLQDTWALRSLAGPISLHMLPRTTFLTTEAVALSLRAAPGRPRAIYAERFFESVSSGIVDINYAENPYPELCLVRSLLTAYRLGLAIAPRLCVFIATTGRSMTEHELEAIQLEHYGRVRHLGGNLAACITDITAHLAQNADDIPYTPTQRLQLALALEAGREQDSDMPR